MALLFVAGACRSDSPVAPAVASLADPTTSYIFGSDPCTTDASYACHGNPVLWGYFSDALVPYGDPTVDCPKGCSTYPLGPNSRSKVYAIITSHISSDPSCSWAKSFLLASYNYSRIRYYDIWYDDEWGDSHWHNNAPSENDIHVYSVAFDGGHDWDLGMTLVHEAAHIHFQTTDEAAAENWALYCFNP
jgi:hypothetical protein